MLIPPVHYVHYLYATVCIRGRPSRSHSVRFRRVLWVVCPTGSDARRRQETPGRERLISPGATAGQGACVCRERGPSLPSRPSYVRRGDIETTYRGTIRLDGTAKSAIRVVRLRRGTETPLVRGEWARLFTC